MPWCPGLVCFFSRGGAEGTGSSGVLCLMFVCVLCKFVSGLIFWFVDGLWFGDLRAG